MLNDIQSAMLKAKGYGPIITQKIAQTEVVASTTKRVDGQAIVASALGRNEADATDKLVRMVARP